VTSVSQGVCSMELVLSFPYKSSWIPSSFGFTLIFAFRIFDLPFLKCDQSSCVSCLLSSYFGKMCLIFLSCVSFCCLPHNFTTPACVSYLVSEIWIILFITFSHHPHFTTIQVCWSHYCFIKYYLCILSSFLIWTGTTHRIKPLLYYWCHFHDYVAFFSINN
jgi:hypothetical protein